MKTVYKTKGTCSSQIALDVEDGVIVSVEFTNGCNGNLQAISRLVAGKKTDEVAALLKGIRCGHKNTSCGDQLARALMQASAAEGAAKSAAASAAQGVEEGAAK